MNGILYINGCPIPVAGETIDHRYGEPRQITLREIASHYDIMDLRNRFECEMRAKYGDRGNRPTFAMFSDTHACADERNRRPFPMEALNMLGEVYFS